MRYHLIDTRTGEIIQERRTNPLLDGIRPRPRTIPSKRRKPKTRAQARAEQHLIFAGLLVAVGIGTWVGQHITITW